MIFIHVPKTAGMTLQAVFSWKYRNHGIIRLGTERPFEELQRVPEDGRARARVVMGHIPYGAHQYLPQHAEYVTVLREPVSRAVSTYRHVIGDPSHRLHDQVAEMDLEEYVSSGINSSAVDNAQTRQIAGLQSTDLDTDALESAKRNLESFLVVGLTDRFDESFILLRRALGWRIPFYVTRNTSARWTHRVTLSDRALELIKERNALDLELYELASRRFQEAIDAEGRSLQREVAVFTRLNMVPDAVGRRAEGLIKGYLRSRAEGHGASRPPK